MFIISMNDQTKCCNCSKCFSTFLFPFMNSFMSTKKNDEKQQLSWPSLGNFDVATFCLFFSRWGKKFLFGKTFWGVWCEKKTSYKSCCKPGFLPVVVYVQQSRTSTTNQRYSMNFIRDLLRQPRVCLLCTVILDERSKLVGLIKVQPSFRPQLTTKRQEVHSKHFFLLSEDSHRFILSFFFQLP